MRCFIFISCFCVYCFTCFGQQACKGTLLDSLTGLPVEFANIGIIGKGVGTVTDEKGMYTFIIPDSLSGETVKISMVGYVPKTYPAGKFTSQSQIKIRQSNITLSEVLVSAKKTKIKTEGHVTRNKRMQAGFNNNGLGAELAVKLNIRHPQTQIRKFMLNTTSNSLGRLPVFRLNIYSVNDKGLPKENITKQNIIIEPKEMTGLIDFDLAPYNIYVNEDVFIAIEWIKDLGDAKGLYFSTKLIGPTYYRKVSQDKWQKVEPGVGLHAEVAY